VNFRNAAYYGIAVSNVMEHQDVASDHGVYPAVARRNIEIGYLEGTTE
jgi:hypothetical protein